MWRPARPRSATISRRCWPRRVISVEAAAEFRQALADQARRHAGILRADAEREVPRRDRTSSAPWWRLHATRRLDARPAGISELRPGQGVMTISLSRSCHALRDRGQPAGEAAVRSAPGRTAVAGRVAADLAELDAFRRGARAAAIPSEAPLFIVGMTGRAPRWSSRSCRATRMCWRCGELQLILALETEAYGRSIPRPFDRPGIALALALRPRLAGGEGRTAGCNWLRSRAGSAVQGRHRQAARKCGAARADRAAFPQGACHPCAAASRSTPASPTSSSGFRRGRGFRSRLDWIGTRTRQVADSMALWKQALDLPDPRCQLREAGRRSRGTVAPALSHFAGLDWTMQCLAPEKTQRSVLTASQWQVRQPIYPRLGRSLEAL